MDWSDYLITRQNLEAMRVEMHLIAREHGSRISPASKPTFGRSKPMQPSPRWRSQYGWVSSFVPALRRTGSFEEAARLAIVPLEIVEERHRTHSGFHHECRIALTVFADNLRRRQERLGRVVDPPQSFGAGLAQVLAGREEALSPQKATSEPAEAAAVA